MSKIMKADDPAAENKGSNESGKSNAGRKFPKHKGKPRRGGRPFKDPIERENIFNDFSWYNKHPEQLNTVAQLVFNIIKGYPLDLGEYKMSTAPVNVSGVMEFSYRLAVGVCTDETSPFQTQVRQLYLALRTKYRGLNTYETPDLAIGLLCIAAFFVYIAKLERMYGVMRYYSLLNRSVPYRVLEALHVRNVSSAEELATFRYSINRLIKRAATLCLPTGISCIERWIFLESNIFKDSDNERGEVYAFNMSHALMWSPTAVNTGSSALSIDLAAAFGQSSTGWAAPLQDYIAFGEVLLNQLLTDSELTLMQSDLVAYYSTNDGKSVKLMQLLELPEDYIVMPTYVENFLEQVHNADVLDADYAQPLTSEGTRYTVTLPTNIMWTLSSGTTVSISSSNTVVAVFQNPEGSVISVPYCIPHNSPANIVTAKYGKDLDIKYCKKQNVSPGTFDTFGGNKLLDSWKNMPNVEDITEMTRLCSSQHSESTSYGGAAHEGYVFDSCGSEFVTKITIYYGSSNPMTFTTGVSQVSGNLASLLSKWDWHPIIYEVVHSSSNAARVTNVFGDLDNFRYRNNALLYPIHDITLMSEWTISSSISFVK